MKLSKTTLSLIISLFCIAFIFSSLQAQEEITDYNSILLKCSNWADSTKVTGDVYRDSCVVNEWIELIRTKVFKEMDKTFLTPAESAALIELADWRIAHDGCQGLGNDLPECMDYQSYLIVKAVKEEFEIMQQSIAVVKDELNDIRRNYYQYAGYPMCSDILGQAGIHHAEILEKLISMGALVEGIPLTDNYIGITADVFEAMQVDGWTVESATTFPTSQTIAENKEYSEKFQNPSRGGCFPGDEEVTALGVEEGFIFKSFKSLESSAIDGNKDKLKSGRVKIKDIKVNDFVLSTTLAALDHYRYQQDCWAKVEDIYKSTTGEWGYENLIIIKHGAFLHHEGEISVTPKHAFYGHTDNRNMRWIAADASDLKDASLTGLDFVHKVDEVKLKKVSHNTPIYNLFVPKTFVYYIGGEKPLLGHNMIIKD